MSTHKVCGYEFFRACKIQFCAESVIEMKTIEISKNQAQEFAVAIFDGIESYIEAHKEEYEEFLQNEEQNGGESI